MISGLARSAVVEMDHLFGWAGRILRVDLTQGRCSIQEIPDYLLNDFLGGAGINAKILYDEVAPEVDPLSPENLLIFGAGPLVGTLAPSGARFSVTAKGPFTFAFCDSSSGGHFGPELKFAGYDHLVFAGRSSKPAYLWIDDDKAQLVDASHLWGKDVWETEEILKEEIGDDDVKIAAIGQAGEKLVRYAAIINDHSRAAGWGGMGAVMGSKQLKAVAVRGTRGIGVAHPEAFEKACLKAREMVFKSSKPKTVGIYGKPWLNWLRNEVQKSNPTKNYQLPRVPPDQFKNVGLEAFMELVVKWKGCFNCPLDCSHILQSKRGPFAGLLTEGFEYNQQIDGQMMATYDLDFVLKWTAETNRLGVDCDGPAYAIAWAMELYERKMITKETLDGIELTWGNQKACLEMLERICMRKDNSFAYLLGEGIDLASRKFGKGSEKFAYHGKGGRLEIDPRTGWATALSHATSTRGADHLKGMPLSNAFGVWKKIPYEFTDDSKTDYKAEAVIFFEHLNAVTDSIGLCKNDTWSQSAECPGLFEFAEMMSSLTGKEYTAESLLGIGERIYNVERAYNSLCGLDRSRDAFQDKFYTEPIETKMSVVDRETFEKLKTEYYTLRGWEPSTGHPTAAKLSALGLESVAEDLKTRKIVEA